MGAGADGQNSRSRKGDRAGAPQPCAARGARSSPVDEAEGYQVQRALHDLLLPHAGPLVGYKIGCTSQVMQEYLGIPHPCGGGVFQKGVHDSGVRLAAADLCPRRGRVRDRGAAGARSAAGEAPFTAEWVGEAVEAYHPAIEIVDDRYVNGRRWVRRR